MIRGIRSRLRCFSCVAAGMRLSRDGPFIQILEESGQNYVCERKMCGNSSFAPSSILEFNSNDPKRVDNKRTQNIDPPKIVNNVRSVLMKLMMKSCIKRPQREPSGVRILCDLVQKLNERFP